MLGFPLTYGVFQTYYNTHEPFLGNPNLPIVGTLGTCFFFLGAPVASAITKRCRRWHRHMIFFGWTFSILGLTAASFAQTIGSLIATQGVVYGLGILIMYYPMINMLNEWFIVRRGLALGIFCASTGVSGLFLPFVLEILLNKYGVAATLRICVLILAGCCGPVLPLLKSRFPSDYEVKAQSSDYSFLKMPQFYAFALADLFQGLGFYFPALYLPSYSKFLGMNDSIGALLLAVFSLAQIVGQVMFGYLSDLRIRRLWLDQRLPVHILVFASPFMSGISIIAIWGLSHTLPMLIFFATMYGIFAAGFVSLWARMVRFQNLVQFFRSILFSRKQLLIFESTSRAQPSPQIHPWPSPLSLPSPV